MYLLVLLIMINAMKCQIMNDEEYEDFKDFLEKTSTITDNDKDTSKESSSEEDESGRYWERSGKFEGDMILSNEQRKAILADVNHSDDSDEISRNALRDATKKWPNNEIIFEIAFGDFSSDDVDDIYRGMAAIESKSCIRFQPRSSYDDRPYLLIEGKIFEGCNSQIGYRNQTQYMNLEVPFCMDIDTIIHELLHTIGFFHMHSDPQRDNYVSILWSNIAEDYKHNFLKYKTRDTFQFKLPYDFASILHYGPKVYSTNGRYTIVPKKKHVKIGYNGLSPIDISKLNKLYCEDIKGKSHKNINIKTDKKNHNNDIDEYRQSNGNEVQSINNNAVPINQLYYESSFDTGSKLENDYIDNKDIETIPDEIEYKQYNVEKVHDLHNSVKEKVNVHENSSSYVTDSNIENENKNIERQNLDIHKKNDSVNCLNYNRFNNRITLPIQFNNLLRKINNILSKAITEENKFRKIGQ